MRLGPGYTAKDRANDFLAVFTGESDGERGMRVLAQIMDLCNPTPSPNISDPFKFAFREGQRWIGAELMGAFVADTGKPKLQSKEGVITDA